MTDIQAPEQSVAAPGEVRVHFTQDLDAPEQHTHQSPHATHPDASAPALAAPGQAAPAEHTAVSGARLDAENVSAWFGDNKVLERVSLTMLPGTVTALIGPSGCGKSTFLRILNRMHEQVAIAKLAGEVRLNGEDIYAPQARITDTRRRIGMVFQKPNPFPKSIYDNVAYGPRLGGTKKGLDDIVEGALRGAALWDEVKDRLRRSAMGLSGGQQQRLCIARAIAVEPEVLLMDEPCSALDPIATARIEDLMQEIKSRYTIVIVTHNMQQAARVSDRTAFFTTEVNPDSDTRTGLLVEVDSTDRIFSNPSDERTENYVTGRFG